MISSSVPTYVLSSQRSKRAILFAVYLFGIIFLYYFFTKLDYVHLGPTSTYQNRGVLKPNAKSFPKKIWQTSKTPSMVLDEKDRRVVQTWLQHNPTFRYEALTFHESETYIVERFADQPDIRDTFRAISDPIFRADLIRYLVLLVDGGVYSDLDTLCLQPIEHWIPAWYTEEANVVVGIEYDGLDSPILTGFSSGIQFATWTIMAKPGHKVMETAINRVITLLKRLAKAQNTSISGIKASYQDVMETTGPASFTEAVFDYLRESTRTNFTYHNLTRLVTPRLISDILVLPITALGSGQHHSLSGSANEETALVAHTFKGSWKGDHPFAPDEPPEEAHQSQEIEKSRQEDQAELNAAQEVEISAEGTQMISQR